MHADMDIDAGLVIPADGSVPVSLAEMGRRIFDLILDVASGRTTRAEDNGHREFALWDIEGLWL